MAIPPPKKFEHLMVKLLGFFLYGRYLIIKRSVHRMSVGIRLSGFNLNRLISSLFRNVRGCMCMGLFILVIGSCPYICIGTLICSDSVVDTRRVCCELVVHAVDTLSTGCQAVSVLYRIPYRLKLCEK